jgi:hypothetical protein
MVGVLSSAARIPLPGTTSADAVLVIRVAVIATAS